jgi:hypothetical protein
MDGASLRKSGPIGRDDSGANPGVLQSESPLFNTIATPHPDNESPNNNLMKEVGSSGKPPGLGGRGQGGAC